jgi:hypothetical protein
MEGKSAPAGPTRASRCRCGLRAFPVLPIRPSPSPQETGSSGFKVGACCIWAYSRYNERCARFQAGGACGVGQVSAERAGKVGSRVGTGKASCQAAGRSSKGVSIRIALPYGKRSRITLATRPARTARTLRPGRATPLPGTRSARSTPWCGSSEPGRGGRKGLTMWMARSLDLIPSSGEQSGGSAGKVGVAGTGVGCKVAVVASSGPGMGALVGVGARETVPSPLSAGCGLDEGGAGSQAEKPKTTSKQRARPRNLPGMVKSNRKEAGKPAARYRQIRCRIILRKIQILNPKTA